MWTPPWRGSESVGAVASGRSIGSRGWVPGKSGFLREGSPAGSVARVVNARAGARRVEDSALLDRIAELEDRLRTLERQLSQRPARRRASRGAAAATPASAADRCPGCLLGIPPGPRGAECVWCGFIFAAVRPEGREVGAKAPGGRYAGPSP